MRDPDLITTRRQRRHDETAVFIDRYEVRGIEAENGRVHLRVDIAKQIDLPSYFDGFLHDDTGLATPDVEFGALGKGEHVVENLVD